MKLFLALAFVAVAAALPEPIRLSEPVLPQVADQKDAAVDAVRVVDSPLPENAPQVEDVAPQAEEVHVDAVKFVDAVQPEIAAENPRIDAVKVVDVPLEAEAVVQPEMAAPEEISAPEEIQFDQVKIAEAPVDQVAPQAEEIKVDAVRVVDAPVQEEVKILKEPEFIVPAPVVLPSAAMPTPVVLPSAALPVVQEIQYGVRFVDHQDAPVVAPIFMQPVMPLIDASPLIVPQQIMDLIMAAEQAQFDAAKQELPRPIVFADPMLR